MGETTLEPKANSVVAFVHAKGVSERLPGKNLRVLGDRPLVCHAIRNALAAASVDLVVIDSDSDEILRVGEEAGAVPQKRPPGLATNKTTGDDLARWQALCYPDASVFVQVVPTCPFTGKRSIDLAIAAVCTTRSSAVGIRRLVQYEWHEEKPLYREDGRILNSQDLPRTVVETTGLYAFRREVAEGGRRTRTSDCAFIGQLLIEAINIDTEEDWQLAELVWKGMQVKDESLADVTWNQRVKRFVEEHGRTPREGELC